MLDDKTFIGAVREFYNSSHRLGRTTATVEIDHLRRLLEMAERPEVTVEQIDFAALFQDEDDRAMLGS